MLEIALSSLKDCYPQEGRGLLTDPGNHGCQSALKDEDPGFWHLAARGFFFGETSQLDDLEQVALLIAA